MNKMDSNVNIHKVLHSNLNSNPTENTENSTTAKKLPIATNKIYEYKMPKTQTPMATNEMKIMTRIYEQVIENQKLPKLPTGKEQTSLKVLPQKTITSSGFPQQSSNILPLETPFLQNPVNMLPLQPTLLQKPYIKILPMESTFQQNPEKIMPLEPNLLQKPQTQFPLENKSLQTSFKILPMQFTSVQNPKQILPLEPTFLQKPTPVSQTNQQLCIQNINEINSSLSNGIGLATECSSLKGGSVNTNYEDNLLQTVSVSPQNDSIKIEPGIEEFISLDTKNVISNTIEESSNLFQQCGIIQLFMLDYSYYVTCFHCPFEFELCDWKKFVEHVEEKHKYLMILKNKVISKKSNEIRQLDSAGILKQQKAGNIYSLNEVNNETPEMFFNNKTQNYFPNQNITLPQKLFKLSISDNLQLEINKNQKIVEVSVLSSNNEKSDQQKAVVSIDQKLNFESDNSEKILEFLKVLRLHPLLWHIRPHGPALWDQEAKLFLKDLNSHTQMSLYELSSSLDNARNFYFRFNMGNLDLQSNANLQEYGKLISEIVTLSKSYIFMCKRCKMYFLDEDNLLKHYEKHTTKASSFKVQRASKQAKRKQKKIDVQKLILCDYCQLSFENKTTLKNHIKEQHPDCVENLLPYKCKKLECNERFRSSYLLRWHTLKHYPPRYRCEFCDKSYYTSFPLKEHRAVHLNQHLMCEYCGKTFFSNHELRRHLWRMHNASKFNCQACDIYFASEKNRIAHNEKFHPNGTNLDRMKKIRRMRIRRLKLRLNPDRRNKKAEWKCRKCDEKFDRFAQLIRHKQDFGHYLYKCSQCETSFSSNITFQRHLLCKHKIVAKTSDLKNYNPYSEKSEIYENEFDVIVE